MQSPWSRQRTILIGVLSLALSATVTPTWAGDGKPFLMKVGPGSTFVNVPSGGAWTELLQMSITPKKDGICVVTAGLTAFTSDNVLQVTLATASAVNGPWVQAYQQSSQVSPVMSQAFIVQKKTPITFYFNARNVGSGDVLSENTRIWVICEQEKTPVIP